SPSAHGCPWAARGSGRAARHRKAWPARHGSRGQVRGWSPWSWPSSPWVVENRDGAVVPAQRDLNAPSCDLRHIVVMTLRIHAITGTRTANTQRGSDRGGELALPVPELAAAGDELARRMVAEVDEARVAVRRVHGQARRLEQHRGGAGVADELAVRDRVGDE